ncbi:MAG TPA: tetratricopeptide repeat protein [Candidatus Sulfotelmatobacter sp.]
MSPTLRPLSGFLLVALFSTIPISTIPSVFAGEPQWVEVRSPNFSVATDAGEKRGREVALRFEQMRAVFGALMTKAKVNLAVPLQIVAFRNTKEMRQIAPLWNGKPTQVAGLFQGGSDRSFIMLDLSTEDPWAVVFHEYAHQLMNGNLQTQADPWFEEGFAEYFSSIEVDGKEARVGKIPRDEYLILQQVGMMKIADLFKVRQNSQTYNESGDHRTTFYAESGMLMHYIYDNQLLLKVADYFDLKINKHLPVEDAIQQAFGISAPQFDKALRNYMSAGRYKYYPIPAPANIAASNYSSRPLSPADANAVLADIHLHSRDYQDKAIAEFQDILKADPNNAAACRGLGYAYLQKQDFGQAAPYFKRASEMDSKDPRVHYYTALLMARESGFSSRADIPALTQELETSISLDPTFADSYALLAFAQTTSGDSAKALATMQKALAIDPRNENYRFNLANIYLANRQPDKAIAVLQSIQNSGNPEIASRVESALANVRQFQEMTKSGGSPVLLVRDNGVPDDGDGKSASSAAGAQASSTTATATKWGAPTFLLGTLNSVDCSTEPSALLVVSSGSKMLNLRVADRNHVILIGADRFSCSWAKQKVAVNYRQSAGGSETDVVSLEIQQP